MLSLLAATVAGRPGRRAAARRCSGAVVGFLALNYFFTPPVGTLHRLRAEEPAGPAACSSPSRRRSPRSSTGRRAGPPRPLRARTEAATLGGLSRSVLTGQDTAEAIVERLRETFGQDAVSLLAQGPAGWAVVAVERRTRARPPPTRATPGSRVDDDHVLALCGEPLRASDQRVLEAFAVQTGLVLEYRRLRERDERAAALESRRGHLDRAAAGGLPRPAHAAGDDARLRRRAAVRPASRRDDRLELVARGRRLRPSSSSASSTTCSTCPGCRAGCSTRQLRTRTPRRGAAAGRRRSPARTSYASRSTSRRRWSPPTPACSSGWSPTWSATPCGHAPGIAGAGAGARAPGDGRGHGRRPGPRRPARAAGADVRAVPAARRQRARRPRPRAGRRPRPRPRPSAARSPPRTPPAAG